VPFAVLGLGGNLGSRRGLLACACELLAGQPGLELLARSPLYETPPLGPAQPDYLNAALKVAWPGSPRALLSVTQHVEQLLQRQRTLRWGPRTLDIDLLYWSGGDVQLPGLTVPHPHLAERLFALVPLLDVVPELAGRFGPQLAPDARRFARSEPFLAPFLRRAGRVRSGSSDDPLELLAALPGVVAALAPGASPAQSTLPFCLPRTSGALTLDQLDAPLSALAERIRAAFASGFRVRAGAVTEVGEGGLKGVFIGQHDAESGPPPGFAHALERGPAGASIWVEPQ
jgi:2-amino-4-hydroxy-6-hydroxymethyldihydropteridine diphosphokinase